ncbi:CDP-alcohol phosphatidyltransferase family protein [Candidatus Woesearchaeota archaeon]|nr:CDP-alcohol phosphatidyltransferase family protein [Candidatus Woesearchaeota archaeon]
MNKKFPFYITYARIVLSLLMIIPAYLEHLSLFLVFYVCAVLSDYFDGKMARLIIVESKEGARLDAIADEIMNLCLFFSILLIRPEIILTNKITLIYIFIIYLLTRVILFTYRGHTQKIPMSLSLSKINHVVLHLGATVVLLFNKMKLAGHVLDFLAFSTTICRIEEILIHFMLDEVPYKINTAFELIKKRK